MRINGVYVSERHHKSRSLSSESSSSGIDGGGCRSELQNFQRRGRGAGASLGAASALGSGGVAKPRRSSKGMIDLGPEIRLTRSKSERDRLALLAGQIAAGLEADAADEAAAGTAADDVPTGEMAPPLRRPSPAPAPLPFKRSAASELAISLDLMAT